MDNVAYLLTCSEVSRDDFMLKQLDLAAQLRKEVGQLLNRWIEAEAYAMLGGILREAKYTAPFIDSGPGCTISDILSAARLQLRQPR